MSTEKARDGRGEGQEGGAGATGNHSSCFLDSLRKSIESYNLKYRPFWEAELPTHLPNPIICVPKERLQEFNIGYKTLLEFASIITGIDAKELQMMHLLAFLIEREKAIGNREY